MLFKTLISLWKLRIKSVTIFHQYIFQCTLGRQLHAPLVRELLHIWQPLPGLPALDCLLCLRRRSLQQRNVMSFYSCCVAFVVLFSDNVCSNYCDSDTGDTGRNGYKDNIHKMTVLIMMILTTTNNTNNDNDEMTMNINHNMTKRTRMIIIII